MLIDGTERLTEGVTLYLGDNLAMLPSIEPSSIDACVTDPPYGLSFMGKAWDHGVPGIPYWKAVFRVLKPGAYLLAFGGTRTFGRMQVAIEDAGFEIRDTIMWLYGSGFPKSHDVSKGIDRAAGAERKAVGVARGGVKPNGGFGADGTEGLAEADKWRPVTAPATDAAQMWEGWGTALKPACEPIVLARKPLSEPTVAANVIKWGTGALNIDGCRVGDFENTTPPGTDRYNQANFEQGYRPDAYQSNGREGEASAERRYTDEGSTNFAATPGPRGGSPSGRWPANVIHDGSDEVVEAFPDVHGAGAARDGSKNPRPQNRSGNVPNAPDRNTGDLYRFGDEGSAARFFYTSKADSDDRLGSKHPTVKPVDLMAYLVRLVTPKGGTVIDPFAGTGTTGEAALREGMCAVLIEREPEYQEDIRRRMRLAMSGPAERGREAIKAKTKDKPADHGPLFSDLTATGRP
jgi:site-specific DNA-methyltransferase (adenine-specific)